MASALSAFEDVLVVCAHPDDESFGLGAVLHAIAESGGRVSVATTAVRRGTLPQSGEPRWSADSRPVGACWCGERGERR